MLCGRRDVLAAAEVKMKNDLNGSKVKKTNKEKWIIRNRFFAGRMIPVVSADLNFSDIIGGWKVRWGINRNDYRVNPGIYSLGNPDDKADVLVTANYKLTFDKLRKELKGMNLWILVLDTDGVNVWCAAGKGTFGTDELISRIKSSGLENIVSHKRLILPQLGAPGIESHIVKEKSGFNAVFGPVYAKDVKCFFENGYRKDDKMRTVRFGLTERMAVSPIELVLAAKYIIAFTVIFGIFSFIAEKNFSVQMVNNIFPILAAFITGIFIFPAFLPFIPFRSFSIKGALLGAAVSLGLSFYLGEDVSGYISNFVFTVPIVSFFALNFTGATTFTSLSGVQLEFKYGIPVMLVFGISGIVLKTLDIFHVI